ncbi:AMP-binding protein [Gordonia sp. VNK21]|uniref:AMP-binding protein n=1 Tax=Gordonia sp. VNK21 TaxID=3382483 RepID=UPI0038D4C519
MTASLNLDPASEPTRSRRNHWINQIRRHADMNPDGPAMRFLGETTTWKELDDRSHRLAAALRRRGVGFGDRLLVVMLNRTEYVEIVIAANIIGAIPVPVNVRMAPPEIGFLVQDSGAKVIVTESMLAPLADAVAGANDAIDHTIVVGDTDNPAHLKYEDLAAEDDSDLPVIDIPEETVAMIMYTSGTTGKPKGAMLTHQNLQAQAMICLQVLGTRRDDIGSCVAPMFHIAGLGAMTPLIYMGALSVIHPLGAFDPNDMLDTLEVEGTTSIFLVPAQWQAVCAAQQAKPRDLKLRVISWGAAPASDTVLNAMNATFPEAMNVAVFGQTEMSPITCVLEGRDALRKLGSIGRVVPAVTARIVDPEMNDVAVGDVGEIAAQAITAEAATSPQASRARGGAASSTRGAGSTSTGTGPGAASPSGGAGLPGPAASPWSAAPSAAATGRPRRSSGGSTSQAPSARAGAAAAAAASRGPGATRASGGRGGPASSARTRRVARGGRASTSRCRARPASAGASSGGPSSASTATRATGSGPAVGSTSERRSPARRTGRPGASAGR